MGINHSPEAVASMAVIVRLVQNLGAAVSIRMGLVICGFAYQTQRKAPSLTPELGL